MTHEELKTAIKKMALGKILGFPASRVRELTDDFKDDLLIDIVKKAVTEKEQLSVIVWLMQSYNLIYNNRKPYPPIFNEMRTRVEFELPLMPPEPTEQKVEDVASTHMAKTIAHLNNENDKLNEENAHLNNENDKLNNENAKLNEENAKLNEENAKLNEENDKLNNENEKLNNENDKLNEENDKLNNENARLLQQLKACLAQPKSNETQQEKNDEWIVELLAHLCFEDEQVARDILNDIRGKEDPVIADIIVERKKRNQISSKTQNREIWKILHAAKLYRGIEGNFNTALRRRQ